VLYISKIVSYSSFPVPYAPNLLCASSISCYKPTANMPHHFSKSNPSYNDYREEKKGEFLCKGKISSRTISVTLPISTIPRMTNTHSGSARNGPCLEMFLGEMERKRFCRCMVSAPKLANRGPCSEFS